MSMLATAPANLDEYYADAAVRARIVEQCGGSATSAPTAAFIAVLAADDRQAAWERAHRVPMDQLSSIWSRRADLARSLWDTSHLLFLIELDYQNIDRPAEPFVHPADTLLTLEPVYQAAAEVFDGFALPVGAVATGRGYHFLGQIPLAHPIVDALATLQPGPPAWYAGVEARRAPGVAAPLTERQARGAAGLGCLAEFAAHLILARASRSRIPVTINGTIVGNAGLTGRECISIDFSHFGDPLDVRHVRMAFSTYQWHRLRPDIFGANVASRVPALVALPRGRRSLLSLLTAGRDVTAARRAARRARTTLPDVTHGLQRLLAAYRAAPLSAFHRQFHAELQDRAVAPPLDRAALPPCVTACLMRPNDLLLKPEHLQHLVRALMSLGWAGARIARLVQSVYEADHGWGDRWTTHMDAATRAEFDVRVFAGLVATGLDTLEDFNCVSAQEKDICPRSGCGHDLRVDRDRLAGARS